MNNLSLSLDYFSDLKAFYKTKFLKLTMIMLVMILTMLMRSPTLIWRTMISLILLITIGLTARAVSFRLLMSIRTSILRLRLPRLAPLILLLKFTFILIIWESITIWDLRFLNIVLIIFSLFRLFFFVWVRTISEFVLFIYTLFMGRLATLTRPWVPWLRGRWMLWNLITALKFIIHSLVNYISTMKADESIIMSINCKCFYC
jgi:hypothetical protein